jgi:hypothetical protein
MSSEGGDVPAGGGAARVVRLGRFPALLLLLPGAAAGGSPAAARGLAACGSGARAGARERLEGAATDAPPPRADA